MPNSFTSDVSSMSTAVDGVQLTILAIMAFCFIACNAVLIYFMLKYKRKSPNDEVSTVKGNHTLEIVWTVIPTIVVFLIFLYGKNVWSEMRTMPEDAFEINVTGQKWSWNYEYSDGRIEAGDLYVPVGKPVKLIMKSKDVIHSFFIPQFRVKEDVVPSIYTYLWFEAKEPGQYNIFCTEYCGDDHSGMLGTVHVLDVDAWDTWWNNIPDPNAKPMAPHERGQELFVKRGCLACHSVDGKSGIGPSFKGLFGRVEQLAGGGSVTVDENYILESINQPDAKLVAGYQAGTMPAFEGQLKEQDLQDLIAYIKTLE